MNFKESNYINEELPFKIGKALANFLNVSPSNILISANAEKYYEKRIPKEMTIHFI